MKLSKIKLAMAASALLLTSGAYAVDGTINFTGSIVASTCKSEVTGTSGSTVDLGAVSASGFKAAGDVSGSQPFTISLTGCPTPATGATAPNMAIQFAGNPNNDNKALLAVTGGAADVGIGIFNNQTDETPIALYSNSAVKTVDTNGAATFNFVAKYVSTASAVTAGQANATATFSIVYP